MPPQVHWLLRAQDSLEETLAVAFCSHRESRKASVERMRSSPEGRDCLAVAYRLLTRELASKLQGTFPDAEAVLVLGCLHGYSAHNGRFVLRVEASEATKEGDEVRPNAYIVKVAQPLDFLRNERAVADTPEEQRPSPSGNGREESEENLEQRLAGELRGWEACQRRGNQRGRIFMYLQPGMPSSHPEGGYVTLKYEDAHQVLRAAEVVTLEQAVIDACCWGRPSAESVDDVIAQTFYEMSDRFYQRSWSGAPASETSTAYWQARVAKGAKGWLSRTTEPGRARREVLRVLSGNEGEFLPPCDYIGEIWAGADTVPEMQRGCAHGDLHGRNVLVGMIDGQAKWPAVYDYEDMCCHNYLAWDFVKLEVELKIRALRHVFRGDEAEFIRAVYAFETELARQTEKLNNAPSWERETGLGTGEDALRGILLGIRRMAKLCLETHRGRNRRWLEEYYFMLTCYGVYAGRFTTYQWREALATYACSGIAAYRYAWRRGIAEKQERKARRLAGEAIEEGKPDFRPDALGSLCWQAQLAFASVCARSRRAQFVREAVKILADLREDRRWIVEVGHELAFALMELSTLDTSDGELHRARAARLLAELEDQFRGTNEELLCRIGRHWKDCGDGAADASAAGDDQSGARRAVDYYREALAAYERAYAIKGNYYPGINVATVHWLLGGEEEKRRAREIAQEVRASIDQAEQAGKEWGEEELWVVATRAEANLLIGEIELSRELYGMASKHKDCTPHGRETMKKQVNRILRDPPKEGLEPGDFDDLFE